MQLCFFYLPISSQSGLVRRSTARLDTDSSFGQPPPAVLSWLVLQLLVLSRSGLSHSLSPSFPPSFARLLVCLLHGSVRSLQTDTLFFFPRHSLRIQVFYASLSSVLLPIASPYTTVPLVRSHIPSTAHIILIRTSFSPSTSLLTTATDHIISRLCSISPQITLLVLAFASSNPAFIFRVGRPFQDRYTCHSSREHNVTQSTT